MADAIVFLLDHYDDPSIINVGTGTDLTILALAELIRDIVGFKGEIRTDPSKPDGTPRKLLDVSGLAGLGWNAAIELRKGIRTTYEWYLSDLGKS